MIAPRTVAAASPPPNSRATIDLSAISSRYVALTSDRDGVNFGSPAISGIRGAAIPTHPLQARKHTGRQSGSFCRKHPAEASEVRPGQHPRSAGRGFLVVALVDDAEPVALGIGQYDEVGRLRVPIPLDRCGAER